MKTAAALGAGVTGATVLTIIHQLLQKNDKDAPRMDLMGMQALSKLSGKSFSQMQESRTAYNVTMAADIVCNSMYYALLAVGRKHSIIKGTILGLMAGIGGITLPARLGLEESYSTRTTKTKALTVGLYLIGGLVAGMVYRRLSCQDTDRCTDNTCC